MKRTVKAWVVIHKGQLCSRPHYTEKSALEDARWADATAVPCTITYDDGVKPKRRAGAKTK